MKNAPHSSVSAHQRRGSRTADATRPADADDSIVNLQGRSQLPRHDPAARIVRAVGDAYTAAPGNWAPASRPVRLPGADLVQLNTEVVDTALSTVDKAFEQNSSVGEPVARDFVADQILRETLLTVSSDWPFMVSKDSAADYARYRAHLHAHATREIAGALATGRREQAERLAAGWNRADGLFGALDARRLPRS